MRVGLLVLALVLAQGCGDEDEGPAAKPGNATPATAGGGAPGAPGQGSAKQLSPQVHIEERVECKPPQADQNKKCDPKLGVCESKTDYCMLTSQGSFCGPCPERDGIRHQFKPRDFTATDNRDPFAQPGQGVGPGDDKIAKDVTQRCLKKEQLVAPNYSYQDMKLVGIVAQGTQRKVLMMDSGNLGWIIRRGDCVGKEKAVVRDIGTNYVTFELADPNQTAREPEQHSVQLHTELPVVSAPPSDTGGATRSPTGTPVIEPPRVTPEKPGASKGATVIVPAPQPQQQQAPQKPQSPPIMINP
jgi:Tfp pilus assembly protein PilP